MIEEHGSFLNHSKSESLSREDYTTSMDDLKVYIKNKKKDLYTSVEIFGGIEYEY